MDGDVDATLVAATEAHVDSSSTTSRTDSNTASSSSAAATATESSSAAASSGAASAAPASMAASHAALVLSVCLLAFTAYAYYTVLTERLRIGRDKGGVFQRHRVLYKFVLQVSKACNSQ